MKKQLLIISILVVIVSIFVSCSANSSRRDGACSIRYNSTTAVTDSNGTTHYYEPVTDDKGNVSTTEKNQGVFAEIETQSNGKAVTEKNGTYVTNEHTTVLPIKDEQTKPSNSVKESSSTKNNEDADNVVEFKPDETTTENTDTTAGAIPSPTTTETTTQKETRPATDKDGWVTKWY